jgi:putative FmdB family regulatory protein
MVQYRYRCVADGAFDLTRPMGTAEPRARCPVCDSEAARVFSAPMLSMAPGALMAAIDSTEKTRDEPAVVSALPPRQVRTRTPASLSNPALQRLPKP